MVRIEDNRSSGARSHGSMISADGSSEGIEVGTGENVGEIVGLSEGPLVCVGLVLGLSLSTIVGEVETEGNEEGYRLGALLFVGDPVGVALGIVVGGGEIVGADEAVGADENVGAAEIVGPFVGDEDVVGCGLILGS